MASPPTISVLIPTYNRLVFFQQALESVRAQTYPHLEIVVSDNASTDATPSLKERYASDSRIRWYRNEENIGLAGNWRKLLYEHARTDYVKILADDDYLGDPDHLLRAADAIQKYQAHIVFAGAGSYDDETHTLVSRSWNLPERLTPDWWMAHIGDHDKGKTLFPNLTTCAVFRLDKARALKAFIDPVFGMDYQLAFELMLSGPSAYLQGIHGVERKHAQNDGFNASLDVVLSSLQLYDRILKYGLSQGFAEKDVRAFCRRFMTVMVRGFVLYPWSRDRGVSFSSLKSLHETLSRIDSKLASQVLLSPGSLLRFFIGGSPKRQQFLRRVYYRVCLWLNPKRSSPS